VSIRRGPKMTVLAQLIASYLWKDKLLGPVNAMARLSSLFDDKPYKTIRATTPQLAYQLYLLDTIFRTSFGGLASKTEYVGELATYGRFALFSVCTKGLKAAGADFGNPRFTTFLEKELKAPASQWGAFCQAVVRKMRYAYKKYAIRYRRTTGK